MSTMLESDAFSSQTLHTSLAILVVLSGITGYLFYSKSLLSKTRRIPSAVFGLPFIGNIKEYTAQPVQYLKDARKKYGKYFEVNMLLTDTIWLMGTDMNKLYLEKKEDVWSFGGGMVIRFSISYWIVRTIWLTDISTTGALPQQSGCSRLLRKLEDICEQCQPWD